MESSAQRLGAWLGRRGAQAWASWSTRASLALLLCWVYLVCCFRNPAHASYRSTAEQKVPTLVGEITSRDPAGESVIERYRKPGHEARRTTAVAPGSLVAASTCSRRVCSKNKLLRRDQVELGSRRGGRSWSRRQFVHSRQRECRDLQECDIKERSTIHEQRRGFSI